MEVDPVGRAVELVGRGLVLVAPTGSCSAVSVASRERCVEGPSEPGVVIEYDCS